MKTFTIYPDKARALGNVMNNNSNVEDMVEVNSNVMALLDDENPLLDNEGNEYVPPQTVEYDNLAFPIFEMGVEKSLYDTSLTLDLSSNNCFVGDIVTVTATLWDYRNELLNGNILFKCGNDCITNGINTGNNNVYANTNNGTVSFPYSFDSMGEYSIRAVSLATNRHHSAEDTGSVIVSKKPITIFLDGISSTQTYVADIPFTVQLYSNNQPLTGLEYSITLDDDLFDTGVSTNNGESYTFTNLDPGEHVIEVYCSGNAMYESKTYTIPFENGKVPDYLTIDLTNITVNSSNKLSGTMTLGIFYNTTPVENMPCSVSITPSGINVSNLITNSEGKITFQFTGLRADVTNTLRVVTSDYGGFTATTLTHTL